MRFLASRRERACLAAQRLGQHFLTHRPLLERIVEAVCPAREPLVVEIGSGRGALTEFLLARAERVVAIEIDAALVHRLQQKFQAQPRLTIIQADVLKTRLDEWGPAVIAGNLPYYITSPILEAILRLGPGWRRAVLLVQREVADRLTARPGSRDYGYLTVATNLFAVPEMLFRVPPAAFSPRPQVDSAAVRLTPRSPADSWGIRAPAPFLEFVSRCFRHKRKTLRNNLLEVYGRQVERWPEAPLRAEQLALEQFLDLYGRIESLSH